MHVIDHGHRQDGVLYHGTLSDLDGQHKATWTYEKDGRKATHDQPIDAATFRSLWNRIGNLDVFKRNRVRDPDRPVDPDRDHIVTIVFGTSEQPQRVFHAIAADESDPQFLNWVKSLNIPKGSVAKGDRAAPPNPGRPVKELDAKAVRQPFAAAREKVYEKFFGTDWKLNRDRSTEGPAIDVYVFEPGEDGRGRGRDFYTLVTGGMSDARMRVPDGVVFCRAELILYVEEPTDQHFQVLRWLAGLPHFKERTWYGPGTTMTNGRPPQPIFDDSDLDCFLFLHPPIGKDNVVHEKLALDGDPTVLLWVVPITEAECQFILDQSLDEFLEVLDRKKHPFLLDEGRRSYVKSKK